MNIRCPICRELADMILVYSHSDPRTMCMTCAGKEYAKKKPFVHTTTSGVGRWPCPIDGGTCTRSDCYREQECQSANREYPS